MGKSIKVTLPDGTSFEIPADTMSPQDIIAMITAAKSNVQTAPSATDDTMSGKSIEFERTIEDIWNSSKKERVALFIRSYLADTLWFNAKLVQDQQLAETSQLTLGETSAIGTYLTRLFEEGLLDRKTNGRKVFYRLNHKLVAEYPEITGQQLEHLIQIYL